MMLDFDVSMKCKRAGIGKILTLVKAILIGNQLNNKRMEYVRIISKLTVISEGNTREYEMGRGFKIREVDKRMSEYEYKRVYCIYAHDENDLITEISASLPLLIDYSYAEKDNFVNWLASNDYNERPCTE